MSEGKKNRAKQRDTEREREGGGMRERASERE